MTPTVRTGRSTAKSLPGGVVEPGVADLFEIDCIRLAQDIELLALPDLIRLAAKPRAGRPH
jgi:hypothetical protein